MCDVFSFKASGLSQGFDPVYKVSHLSSISLQQERVAPSE